MRAFGCVHEPLQGRHRIARHVSAGESLALLAGPPLATRDLLYAII